MNLEEKAKNLANRFDEATINEKSIIESSFKIGYNECKNDLIDFLKVNHRASVKDILKHLEALV